MYWHLVLNVNLDAKPTHGELTALMAIVARQAIVVNAASPGEERGFLTLSECQHDVPAHPPCTQLQRHDLPPIPE